MESTVSSHRRLRVHKEVAALAALVIVIGTLAAGYRATRTPIVLVVDDQAQRLYTHQDTVAALLMDVGLELHPKDIVIPAPRASIRPGLTVQVKRAHPVHITADGHEILIRTQATSVEEVLAEAGVSLRPQDEVEIEGRFPASNPKPARLIVHRAVPLTLHEDGEATALRTTASTVGEALREAGLTLHLADRVEPGLGEPVSTGMHVHVQRSVPVTVHVDGRTIRTRTHRERVGGVLADLGLVLAGEDYTTPTLDAPVRKGSAIEVVRVNERFLIEQEPIPFESVWRPDPDLEIDHRHLMQEGTPGVRERRIRVRYENGREVSRTVEAEYVAASPKTRIMGYGTKIIVRTLDTPSGPVEYWRKVSMLATSYSPATAGTPKTSRWYGRTATGMKMRKGIIAVDPRIVNLGSKVYVPGYGIGTAGDTGGAIEGRRIDLGYSDDDLVLWHEWVNVYLLTPVPPPDQIDYTLP